MPPELHPEIFAHELGYLFQAGSSFDFIDRSDIGFPFFSSHELHEALLQLNHGKAAYDQNLVAEMLKYTSFQTKQHLLNWLNRILSDGVIPPHWQQSKFRMIAKALDSELPSEYRPIAILSIPYKVFAKLIHSRIHDVINFHLSNSHVG